MYCIAILWVGIFDTLTNTIPTNGQKFVSKSAAKKNSLKSSAFLSTNILIKHYKT